MLKLVIFDMDGVLVDACDWHKSALNAALKQVCGYEISEEDHYEVYNGLPTKVKLKKLVSLGFLRQADSQRVLSLKQEKTIDIIERESEESKEKIELITWLKSEGYSVACFTNSIRETATLMLRKAGVYELLSAMVTNQDVTEPKPSPEGYLKLLEQFGVEKEDVFIVEDSPKGLQAARSVGCKVMQVKNATEVTIQNIRRFIDENFDSNGW